MLLLALAVFAAVVFPIAVTTAQAAPTGGPHSSPKPTVVPVHGAWGRSGSNTCGSGQ